MFETNRDVLTWYEKQPRALTKEFLETISWADVRRYPLNEKFIPVLIYMRDVESLTEIYYDHLKRTPTGKDPIISKFMERWGVEEQTHGEILNRFLNEAGVETGEEWYAETKREIPRSYKISSYLTSLLTNCIGKRFTAAHMTYGAANEISTLQGYRQLIKLAEHPILTQILKALMREESVHAQFYWSVARLELQRSEFAQKISRFVVSKFWVPVGQGAKSEQDANNTIATLFGGEEGFETVQKNICQRIQLLPGFAGLNTISERVANICKPEELLTN